MATAAFYKEVFHVSGNPNTVAKQRQNQPNRHSLEKRLNRWGWIFVSLSIVLITIFVFIPMIGALIMSFQTGKGVNMHFGGLTNYIRLFHDQTVGKALGNTFVYLPLSSPYY